MLFAQRIVLEELKSTSDLVGVSWRPVKTAEGVPAIAVKLPTRSRALAVFHSILMRWQYEGIVTQSSEGLVITLVDTGQNSSLEKKVFVQNLRDRFGDLFNYAWSLDASDQPADRDAEAIARKLEEVSSFIAYLKAIESTLISKPSAQRPTDPVGLDVLDSEVR